MGARPRRARPTPELNRALRIFVDAEIRPATLLDMPALATWSGLVDEVFRPALDRDDRLFLVAHANGRFPIGHVMVDLGGAIISHLLVLGGFRDQGLGTALMAEAEKSLRDRNAARIALAVEKTNEGAIRLYERLGYTTRGETEETWIEQMPDGEMQPVTHPAWVMEKELRVRKSRAQPRPGARGRERSRRRA
jgi:ribosomal protein S18 acetylase RimI-like enzyme